MKTTTIFAAVAAAALLAGCMEQTNRQTATFTVESKERKCDGSGSGDSASIHCYYVVYGTNGEVFRNEDILFNTRGPSKLDSASVQARLHVGHVYRVQTIGWRNPLFSMFPNIVTADEVR